jgi:hypothetical protein
MEEEYDTLHKYILTRYLYSKTDVTHSLFLSMLEHKHREALYWAYEIYFSGFQEDVFEFILRTYKEVYETMNPDLLDFITNTIELWIENQEHHWLLGSIVYTLSKREYDLSYFIEFYFQIKCQNVSSDKFVNNGKKYVINMCESDIEKYKTIIKEPITKSLQHVCEFPIRKNVIDLFNSFEPSNINEIYADMDNWLYYAARSPIWRGRLTEYDAVINENDVSIDFKNETKREEFYERWNYDIEEQSVEIQDAINGENIVQLTVKDFAAKYGVKLVTKKMKPNKKQQPPPSPPLENTITYHNKTNMSNK